LTTRHRKSSFTARVRRIIPFIASLLLAIWLPVTQHCGLEEAGLIPSEPMHEASAQCCDENGPCTHDACSIVESGYVKFNGDSLKVPLPHFVSSAFFLCLRIALPALREDSILATTACERPLDWVSSWSFVRRTAPLSRAPSLLG